MNDKIRAPEVRLIDQQGEQVGIVPLEEALSRAKAQELDLVEVAPDADPPVCKILDYRRQAFESKRRQKEARKKSKSLELKEIKLRPNIDKHDYEIKMRHVREFLEKGHKVKVTMRFRQRELRHTEIGTAVLQRMAEDLSEIAEVDSNTNVRDSLRVRSIVLGKKKTKDKPKEKASEETKERT